MATTLFNAVRESVVRFLARASASAGRCFTPEGLRASRASRASRTVIVSEQTISAARTWGHLPRRLATAFLFLGFLGANANAQIVKNFEFDAGLPSTEGMSYCRSGGTPEAAVFSVADGILRQRLLTLDNSAYVWGSCPSMNGGLDRTRPIVMEARVQVLTVNGPFGMYMGANNGANRYYVWFGPDGVRINNPSGSTTLIPVNVFAFHVYRVESPPCSSEYRLFIDGVLAGIGQGLPAGALNSFAWAAGQINSNTRASADWDYFRFSQAGPFGISIRQHPGSVSICPSGTANFSVTAACSGPFTYQWQWQQVGAPDVWNNLAEGPNADSGGIVRFTATGVLAASVAVTRGNHLQGAVDVIQALRCIVTNSFGSITSNAATVTICIADTDDGTGTGVCDGGVTIDDLLYYLTLFDLGLIAADVDDGTGTGTPDGGVTIEDLLYYLARFDAGC